MERVGRIAVTARKDGFERWQLDEMKLLGKGSTGDCGNVNVLSAVGDEQVALGTFKGCVVMLNAEDGTARELLRIPMTGGILKLHGCNAELIGLGESEDFVTVRRVKDASAEGIWELGHGALTCNSTWIAGAGDEEVVLEGIWTMSTWRLALKGRRRATAIGFIGKDLVLVGDERGGLQSYKLQ